MSFASKIVLSSARLWNGISISSNSRGFHMLMRPIAAAGETRAAVNSGGSNQQSLANTNALQGLLTPFSALLQQVAGFKVKGRLKRRCKDCYVVVREERGYVICPTHPRHKQMSMKKRDYKSWILTHATQSKERSY